MCQKNSKEKKLKWLCQNNLIFTKIIELYQVSKWFSHRYSKRFQVLKCSSTLKLYKLKALLSKNRFYFFFLMFWHATTSPSFRIPRYWNYIFTYRFLKFFSFFIFNRTSQKSDKSNSIRLIFIKIIKKISIIKIYIKILIKYTLKYTLH